VIFTSDVMFTVSQLKSRISVTKSVVKVTKAMQVIAATKLQKSKIYLTAIETFMDNIVGILGRIPLHMVNEDPEIESKYHFILNKIIYRDKEYHYTRQKSYLYFICSTNRGLCSNLNTALFEKVSTHVNDSLLDNVFVTLICLGKKARSFGKSHISNPSMKVLFLDDILYCDSISENEIQKIISLLFIEHKERDFSKMFLCYNTFVSSLSQLPTIVESDYMMPSEPRDDYRVDNDIFDVPMDIILNLALKYYLESIILYAIRENLTCEHAMRITAMHNATINGKDMIDHLMLEYNKTRQGNITRELIDIISGAQVVC